MTNTAQTHASTFAPHKCTDATIWHNQGIDATYRTCMYCGKILAFRWKSWIKRITSIFQEP